MSSSVLDETKGASAISSQMIAIVGDFDHGISRELVTEIGCGSTTNKLVLDNRYYSADVDIRRFRSSKELVEWHMLNENSFEFGALIFRFRTRNDLDQLTENLHRYHLDAKIVIMDMDMSRGHQDFVQNWAHSVGFELMFIGIEGRDEEPNEYNEKVGMARVVEILHTVNWPHKQQKIKNLTGKENVDRILTYMNTLPSDDEDDLEPDEDDEAAIWNAFSPCGMKLPKMFDNGQVTPVCSSGCSSNSVSVDITLSNQKIAKNASADIVANKQIEGTSNPSQEENFDNSVDLSCDNKYEKDDSVLDTLIKDVMDGKADFTIGDMKGIRDQIAQMSYDDKSRIDKAEAIVTRIAEKLTDPSTSNSNTGNN